VISPTYLQAGIILALVFFLILAIAGMRRHYLNWSFQGATVGILLGFILALILEGFLLVSGGTFLTKTLGWKNAPKPVEGLLNQGRERLQELVCVEEKPVETEKSE